MLLVILQASGCARPGRDRSITVRPSALAQLAAQQRDGAVVWQHGSESVGIRSENDARIELETRPCATPQEEFQRVCNGITLPLEQLHPGEDASIFPGIHPADVSKATLHLDSYVRPDWRPTFGIGLALFGPAYVGGIDVQWLPVDTLALQVGSSMASDLFAGYAAFRLRPTGEARVRPWAGGFVSGGCSMDASGKEEASCFGAFAARLGFDWSFESGTVLVSPEIDALFPLHEYLGIDWPVAPWGGITVSAMY